MLSRRPGPITGRAIVEEGSQCWGTAADKSGVYFENPIDILVESRRDGGRGRLTSRPSSCHQAISYPSSRSRARGEGDRSGRRQRQRLCGMIKI